MDHRGPSGPHYMEEEMRTLDLRRTIGAGFGIAALLLALPTFASAQGTPETKLTFDSRGGIALPAGRLADATVPGASMGAMIGYQVNRRVSLFGAGDLGLLRGKKLDGATEREPGLNLWQYSGGAEVNLLDPDRTRWGVLASLGAGATTFDSKVEGAVTRTRFATNGGVRLAYRLGMRADAFLGGQSYLIFTDEELQGARTNWVFPVSAGLKIRV